jgi:hypothetical protein
MPDQACASCGKPVENAAVTGVFCGACYERDLAPKPGWKTFFSGPAYVGIVAVLLPWVVHVDVNGVQYVSLGGGGVGVLAALAAGAVAIKGPAEERMKKLAPAGLILLLGLVDVAGSGILGR